MSINSVLLEVSRYYNSHWTTAAAAVCIFPAVEMALHSIGSLAKGDGAALSAHLGSALLLAGCASNYVPVTARAGAIAFAALAYMSHGDKSLKDYASISVIGTVIAAPLDHAVIPATKFVYKQVSNLLSRIHLPKDPVWIGVSLLVVLMGATFVIKNFSSVRPLIRA